MNEKDKNRIPSWVSIALTIILAVSASIGTYSARMYKTEKEIEILQVKVGILETTMIKTSSLLESINERTIRIEEGLKMKADKTFINNIKQ